MNRYVQILEKQTDIILMNIDFTLSFIGNGLYDKRINGYIISKQLYHMLNSIDRIFIAPDNYSYPDFHIEGLNSLDQQSESILDKQTLCDYFSSIKEKVSSYLKNMNDNKLLEEVVCQEMKLTRFDLILAQMRHITWHLAYLHSCLKVETGNMPNYIGVNKDLYPL